MRADPPKEAGLGLSTDLYSEGKHRIRLTNLEARLESSSQGIIRGRLEAKMEDRAREGAHVLLVSDQFIPRDTSRRKRLQQIRIVSVVSTCRGQVFLLLGEFSQIIWPY